ncbi:MAG: mycofactocin biosynthesis peptidyl-dipeptidase MftE [Acidimicrobiales bacterium]
MRWPEVAALASRTLLAIPVGSTEQHGPHLPLSTDTDIAIAVAGALSRHRVDVAVAPAVAYGSSGEHAGFPGTLSIGQEALEALLVELARSADDFAGVLFVSAHGGNAQPVAQAVRRLGAEGRRVRAWSPPAGDPTDSHAGRTETSVMLAVNPVQATLSGRPPAGVVRPIGELMPALRRFGVGAVSRTGVLGDPAGASAEIGREALERWTQELVAALEGWP